MKSLKFKPVTALPLLLLIATPLFSLAFPGKDFTKSINKEFEITRDGLVGVTNKYGDVDIRTWDASRVKFEVTIRVDARSQDAADEVFKRISVTFSDHASSVKAVTEIESASSWKKWFGWGSSDDFEIDYVVYVPASVNLELDNRYGDIYVGDKSGRTHIILKYGDMRLGQLSGRGNISMAYADGSVQAIGDVELDLAYSDLSVAKAGRVTMDAKYSDVALDNAGDITATTAYVDVKGGHVGRVVNSGKYDDFVFEKVIALDVNSKYTSYTIDELSEYAKFEMGYGSLSISHVLPKFTSIDIRSSYTDVTLGVDAAAAFILEAATRYCDIRHHGIEVTYDVEKSSEHTLKGFRGSSAGTSRITADMSYGELVIR